MSQAALVVGAAVGYVLGARAGLKRFEQIKGQASRLWNSDRVKHRVGDDFAHGGVSFRWLSLGATFGRLRVLLSP